MLIKSQKLLTNRNCPNFFMFLHGVVCLMPDSVVYSTAATLQRLVDLINDLILFAKVGLIELNT